MSVSHSTNQSNRGKTPKTPTCSYCKEEGHWMKNFEEITCPKLKEKKQKEKLARQAAKTEKVWQTAPPKKEIETTNNFDIFKQMMDQEEQAEAELERQQQEQEVAKQMKRDKKKGKNKKKTEKVYYDMPEDLK